MIKVYQASEFGNNEKPYKLVAQFWNHNSLQEAYRDTQNIVESWSEDGHRSTSSGDVIVTNCMVEGKNPTAYFLVPMGNGRSGNKMYENWGETEVITNFDIDGFEYQGKVKRFMENNGTVTASSEELYLNQLKSL